jgi:hypothetical protein
LVAKTLDILPNISYNVVVGEGKSNKKGESEMKNLEKNPTKQQEIDWLREVAASVPDGAYLAHLFSEAFVERVAAAVRSDVFPDFEDWHRRDCEDDSKNRLEMAELEGQVERLGSQLQKECEEHNVNVRSLNDRITMLRNQLDEAHLRNSEQYDRLLGLEDELVLRDDKILRLKAMLWDLEHPER